MSTITVRDFEDALIAATKRRAADNGMSIEEEIRRILTSIYSRTP
jgi:plasmid stability protein